MELHPARLLKDHTVLQTSDISELHSYVSGMVGAHSRIASPSGPLTVELRHASLGRLQVGLHYSSSALMTEIDTGNMNCFLVQFPLSGSIELDVDGRHLEITPGSGAVLSPGQYVRRTGRPGWTLAFQAAGEFVRSRVGARLRRSLRGALSFHPRIGSQAAELLDYGLLVVEAIDRGAAPAGSAVAMTLEEGFINLLIEIQPHSQGRGVSGQDRTDRMTRMQSVAAFVDKNLESPLTIGQLATVADCSVRTLQLTFLELSGLSPMRWVLRQRLSAARRLLEVPDIALSVSDVALRTGFAHMSRFAGRYRERYGESPAETRRRSTSRGAGAPAR